MKLLIIPLLLLSSICFSQADSVVVKVPVGQASGMAAVINYLLKSDSNTYTSRGYYRLKLDSIITALSTKGSSNFSGSYNDLNDKPSLFDGTYSSLSGKPSLFDGIYASLTSKPDLTVYKLKTDTGRVGGNAITGASLKWVIDSIAAAMAAGYSTTSHTHTFASLTSKPTTLSGYGITDAVANTITVNGHALSGNVSVTTTDLSLNNVTNESKATMFTNPAFTGTPTGITASHVGLGNVINESKATMFASPTFTGTVTLPNSAVTNAMLAGSIAYSKLSLTGAILNADLAGSIAYSKLSLTGAILNADLAGSIAYNKLVLSNSVTNSDLAGSITESKLSITDLTTGNVSTSAHGFAPKGDGTTTKYLNANGVYSTPSGTTSTINFLASDVTNNNASANTISDVTALSFAVTSGVTYRFKFFIVYTSAATTTGSRWAINGPSTTFLNYTSRYTLTATSETVNYAAAYDSPAASNASSLSTGNIAIIEGIIKPSASGTVIARFASEVSSSAIVAKAGQSYVEFQAVN